MVYIVEQNYAKNKEIFNSIVKELKEKIKEDVPIDHVGSTAINNMVGKNIIDILIGAKDENQFEYISGILTEMGYYASSKKDIYQFFASRKEETVSGDIHIHLVILGTNRYNEFIILRDYLLSNEKEVMDYCNCKKGIMELENIDRNMYKEIKSKYVSDLIERAKKYYNIK